MLTRTCGRCFPGSCRKRGYQVFTCGGPSTPELLDCPLLAGGTCPAVDGADVILSSGFGASTHDDHRRVIQRLTSSTPQKTVMEATEWMASRITLDLHSDGCTR